MPYKDFELLIGSSPDRDEVYAEIWYREKLFAEVYRDGGELRLLVYDAAERGWDLPYDAALTQFAAARRALLGEAGRHDT